MKHEKKKKLARKLISNKELKKKVPIFQSEKWEGRKEIINKRLETKIKKQLLRKGKKEKLKSIPDYDVSGEFQRKEKEIIEANRIRRVNLKINQPKYPDNYYADCYINSKKNK